MILIVAAERLPMKITRAVDIATKDRLQSLKIESEYLLMTAPLRNSKEYARLEIVEEKIKQLSKAFASIPTYQPLGA